MTFHPGGQLSYQGSMTGGLTGMSLQGDGSWRVGNGRLLYRGGDNQGSSALDVGIGTLSLSPDPVVAIPGGGDVDTMYIRVK